ETGHGVPPGRCPPLLPPSRRRLRRRGRASSLHLGPGLGSRPPGQPRRRRGTACGTQRSTPSRPHMIRTASTAHSSTGPVAGPAAPRTLLPVRAAALAALACFAWMAAGGQVGLSARLPVACPAALTKPSPAGKRWLLLALPRGRVGR